MKETDTHRRTGPTFAFFISATLAYTRGGREEGLVGGEVPCWNKSSTSAAVMRFELGLALMDATLGPGGVPTGVPMEGVPWGEPYRPTP